MVKTKLCACIAYSIRVARRESSDAAEQYLWKALYASQFDDTGLQRPVKISLYDALQTQPGNKTSSSDEAVAVRVDVALTSISEAATQTLHNLYTEDECKQWVGKVVENVTQATTASMNKLLDRLEILEAQCMERPSASERTQHHDSTLQPRHIPARYSSASRNTSAQMDAHSASAEIDALDSFPSTLEAARTSHHAQRMALKAERRRNRQVLASQYGILPCTDSAQEIGISS